MVITFLTSAKSFEVAELCLILQNYCKTFDTLSYYKSDLDELIFCVVLSEWFLIVIFTFHLGLYLLEKWLGRKAAA